MSENCWSTAVSARDGTMTFGMTQQSSYSAAPTAFAMVMPSPVLSALPWYWKPILLMAGTSWSQYSLLPPKPPIASTTARAMMSCFPSGPSTRTPVTASPSWMSSVASVESMMFTPRFSSSACIFSTNNAPPTWPAAAAETSGLTVSVPTWSLAEGLLEVHADLFEPGNGLAAGLHDGLHAS